MDSIKMEVFSEVQHRSGKFIKKVEYHKEYKIINKIGHGAYGIIYSALDIKRNEHVAIKVVAINNKTRKKLLQKEVKIMSLLEGDKNFVQIRNFFEFSFRISPLKKQKYCVIVMEKMELDLMDYILVKGRLSEAKAKYIIYHVCLAVQKCHSNGLAHLDLKPDNVLLRLKPDPTPSMKPDDTFETLFQIIDDQKNQNKQSNEEKLEIKLCDFGFTHFWERERVPKFVGTKEYLPPEIRFHSAPYLPSDFLGDKADVWSLGVMLFCMITGLFPFLYENNHIYTVNFDIINENTKGDLCLDLLEKIFNPIPADRPSIAQILNHPWLADSLKYQYEEKYKSKSSPSLRSASRNRLPSKFQKLVYMVASQL